MSEESKRKGFVYEWRIENFNFCWHKTGEYIESPLFHIEPSHETSWSLRLYPRGEDDGEYVGCFLCREEGGPEVVDVDFELFVSVGGSLVKPPICFEKIYSLKIGEKEGEKSYVQRREIMSRSVALKKRFTLVFGCTIFNRKEGIFDIGKLFGRTTIGIEYLSGMEVFDDFARIDSGNNMAVEVKAPLEVDPLISINLWYFNENIVIKIDPNRCEKMKYAVCKITVIKNWDRKHPIKHFRHWIGEIKTDIWRYDAPLPHIDAEQDEDKCAQDTFLLHYYFAYSIGDKYEINETKDYGTDLWIEDLSLLEPPIKKTETEDATNYLTATKALKSAFRLKTHFDFTIKTKYKTFNVSKSVLRARSSTFCDILKDNPESIEILDYSDEIIQKFLDFLCTDNVDDLDWETAHKLCVMASHYKVELLEKKCSSFLKMNLQVKKASELLLIALSTNNPSLRAYAQKYIMEHDEEIFRSNEWYTFTKNHWELAEKCMLLKSENMQC